MSIHRYLARAGFLVLVLLAARHADAQLYQPFADLNFDPDYQLFAPAITEEYGDIGPPANTGVFFAYDRLYLNVTRPESANAPWEGDFTWANRISMGYMTDEDNGWLLTYWDINSANINRQTVAIGIDGSLIPLTRTENDMEIGGVELNKTFRLKRLHNGGYIEPYVGIRYIRIKDQFREDTLTLDDPFDPMEEIGTSVTGNVENHMYGGQVGVRAYNRHGHWILSGDFRAFGLQNHQSFYSETFTQTTVGDGSIADPFVTANSYNETDAQFQEFVVGGELRVEAAYEITREVSLRFGLEILYLGGGIGRGSQVLSFNNDDVTAAGLSFGFTVNR